MENVSKQDLDYMRWLRTKAMQERKFTKRDFNWLTM